MCLLEAKPGCVTKEIYNIGKIGAFILDYSKDLPVFYGLTSVVLAVILGIGAAILRRYISKWNTAREAKLKA